MAAKSSALLPHLDERRQRLYVASEARSLGHGGIAAVARAAGMSRQTVAAGVEELESGEARLGRTRRPGGGVSARPRWIRVAAGVAGAGGTGHARNPMSPLR